MPFVVGARPTNQNVTSLLVDRSWRAQLAVTGVDGLPPVGAASSVMLPATSLRLSLRLPPTVDPDAAGQAMEKHIASVEALYFTEKEESR